VVGWYHGIKIPWVQTSIIPPKKQKVYTKYMSEETHKQSKYTNLEPNVAAALSYILTPFTGIAFFVIEKDDKFVRFHAMQSIISGLAFIVLWTLLSSFLFFYVGFFIARLISLATFALYLFLMWKAYSNEKYELPYIGKIANDIVEKK
jgi:uncharacterized membrane protein